MVARAHVDDDRLALADDALARLMVWSRGMCPGSDDRRESRTFCAERDVFLMDLPGDLPLGLARADRRGDAAVRLGGDLERLAQQRDLRRRLDSTQLLDDAVGGDPLDLATQLA